MLEKSEYVSTYVFQERGVTGSLLQIQVQVLELDEAHFK